MKDEFKSLVDQCRSAGNCDATSLLWNEYFPRLCEVVRRKLPSWARRVHDEEDVALGVIAELFHGLANGAYSGVQSRDDLWAILVVIASRRVVDATRIAVRHHSELQLTGRHAHIALHNAFSADPQPIDAVMLHETLTRFFACLNDGEIQIARLRLEGKTVDDIATAVSISRSVAHRRIQEIRDKVAFLLET